MAIRESLEVKLHQTIRDPQGRYLILICNINWTTYTLGQHLWPKQTMILQTIKQENKPSQKKAELLWVGTST